ncbi:suppression of tumorigenicity 5 protein isoform x4 [Limosa lapponica baueri]|uniref:Suppression of tumorigenicity 5 protein isoform x4 n=1 Tax=Limosa lapponica baueri TaxID=1758121 RepID=A0A2I0UFE3_LIMLA|nr:suppression of tumorigenicity 5 protein isoform x4 [Limosa lapponica baueri]
MLEQAPGMTHGEKSPGWSRFFGRICDPVEDPRWGSLFMKDYIPWKRPMVEQFVKNCSLWEGLMLKKSTVFRGRDPMLEQGKSVRSPPPEEEGAAETCEELTTTSIPRSPVLLKGRRQKNWA